MSENPYAPPRAELSAPPRIGESPGGALDLGRCISEAWRDTWANFPLWLGVGIVGTLAMLGSVLTIIGIIAALPVLFWGSYVFLLRMRDGGAQLSDLFSGFSRYAEALGGMLAFWGVTLLVGVPGNAASFIGGESGSGWLIGLGYSIAIGVGFFVTPRLQFAPFLMVDRGLGVGEALAQSWRSTAQFVWLLIVLTLLMGAAVMAGLLALIVGVIPAMIFASLLWASAYRQIFGNARAS